MNPEPAASDSRGGGRFPPQIKYIVGNEACERFSYYGMVGILEVYLTQRMKLAPDHATELVHIFTAAVYFMPLFGGWLADRWLGRYWTILSISLFYCLGHGTLALYGNTFPGLYAGLALIAIGSGGIKPCVAAFVGDQFRPDQEHLLTKVYGWFYWSVNFGATFAFLIIPTVSDRAGYGWAFGIPGIFMALATLIFWLGTKHYVRRPPQAQSEKRPAFFAVVWHALTHQGERKPGQGFFDVALARFPAEEVESARTVAGILIIFVTIPVFWALFYQSNSTWVLQGNNMTPLQVRIFQWNYKVDGERMQAAGSILVMILVPVLTLGVYPLFERWGILPTPLRRMSAGMVFGAASFVVCGFLQSRLDHGAVLSVAWQLAPYIVLEIGEVLLSATALEFAFEQAPSSMKSIIMSFWLMTITGGNFLIAVFTKLKAVFLQSQSGASVFYFYAVLMFIVAGIFIALASRYRYRETTESDATAV
jgi:POT family proton-dependent oligopeptide transporter